MQAGFYSWPERFRHVGLIVALVASLFWFQQQVSLQEEIENQPAYPEDTCRVIERELLALDIAHNSNDFIQWYLGWGDRELYLRQYANTLSQIEYPTDAVYELQDQIDLRLKEEWPTETNSLYLTRIFFADGFFLFCELSVFLLFAHFIFKKDKPNHKPPLPWFSVGWVLMVFFIADITSKIITGEIYKQLYEHQIFSNSIYIITDGLTRAIVPFLVCAVSFSQWKHFKKKLFPDFRIHWKLIFFISGCTYLASYLISFILPLSDQITDLGPADPTAESLIYTFISSVIFAAIFEEITFRGFIFQGLRHKLGFFISAVISSILFASIHLQYDPIMMIHVGLGGFAGCWITHRTGSLTSAIVLHALHNLACTVSYFLCYQYPI